MQAHMLRGTEAFVVALALPWGCAQLPAGLFGDMEFIADYYKPDLVLLPIGGHLRQWLRPRYAIPMHDGADPLGKGRPEDYVQAAGRGRTQVLPLKPGDSARL